MIGDTEEKLVQASQVTAKAGPRKLERLSRILEYKDQVREDRRKARLLDKGY